MYIVKYGTFYIKWVNYQTYEFGVDNKDKAKIFDNRNEIDNMIQLLGLGNVEVIKL